MSEFFPVCNRSRQNPINRSPSREKRNACFTFAPPNVFLCCDKKRKAGFDERKIDLSVAEFIFTRIVFGNMHVRFIFGCLGKCGRVSY